MGPAIGQEVVYRNFSLTVTRFVFRNSGIAVSHAVCHTYRTPQFLVVHAYIHVFTGVCVSSRGLLFGGLSWVFFLESFVGVCFVYPPLLSEYIHYNRKLNITFNFRFHMYEISLKRVTSHALGPPPPCHKLSHLLGPPPPRG